MTDTIINSEAAYFTEGERVILTEATGAYSRFTSGQEVTVLDIETTRTGSTYITFADDNGDEGHSASISRFAKIQADDEHLAEWERELLGGVAEPEPEREIVLVLDAAGLASLPVGSVLREVRDLRASEWVITERGIVYDLSGETLAKADQRKWDLAVAVSNYGPFELISEPEQDTPVYVLDGEGLRALPAGSVIRDNEDDDWTFDGSHLRLPLTFGKGITVGDFIDYELEEYGPFEVIKFGPEALAEGDKVTTVEQVRTLPLGTRLHDQFEGLAFVNEAGIIFESSAVDAIGTHVPRSTWAYPEHEDVVTNYDLPHILRGRTFTIESFPVVERPEPTTWHDSADCWLCPEPEVEAPQAYRVVSQWGHNFEIGQTVYRLADEESARFEDVRTYGLYATGTDVDPDSSWWVDGEAVIQSIKHTAVEAIVVDTELAEAEVEDEAFAFEVGDRVRFVADYDRNVKRGDTGTVRALDRPIHDEGFLYIDLDKGASTSCFPHRVELLTEEPVVFSKDIAGLDLPAGSVIAVPNGATYTLSPNTGRWYSVELRRSASVHDLAEVGFRVVYVRD